jgi:hypothetical protein
MNKKTTGYDPIPLPDWRDRLASLAGYAEQMTAASPGQPAPGFDPQSRAALIADYISDLETCLLRANARIYMQDMYITSLNRLIDGLEKARSEADAKTFKNAPVTAPVQPIEENGNRPRFAVCTTAPESEKMGRQAFGYTGSEKDTANPSDPVRLYSLTPSRGF